MLSKLSASAYAVHKRSLRFGTADCGSVSNTRNEVSLRASLPHERNNEIDGISYSRVTSAHYQSGGCRALAHSRRNLRCGCWELAAESAVPVINRENFSDATDLKS